MICHCLVLLLMLMQPPATVEQARSAVREGDYPLAQQIYQQLIETQPDDPELRLGLARVLAFEDQYEEAIAQYTHVLEARPGYADALLGRGRTLAWNRQYELALRDLRQLTADHADYADAWSALGDVLLWSDRPEEAAQAYTRWIELAPDDHRPWVARYRARSAAGQNELAELDKAAAQERGYEPAPAAVSPAPATVATPAPAEPLTPGVEPAGPDLADGADMEQRWRIAFDYGFNTFNVVRADWHTYSTSIQYRFSDELSASLQYMRTRRFSKWDEAVAIDTYFDLWPRAYGNLRFQVANNADVIARWDVLMDVYHSLPHSLELLTGYRHMDFSSNNVDLYTLGLGKYWGNWYLRGRVTFNPVHEVRTSYGMALRYIWSRREFVEIGGGFGESEVTTSPGRFEERGSWSMHLRSEWMLTNNFGIGAGVSYSSEEKGPDGVGVSLGVRYRF